MIKGVDIQKSYGDLRVLKGVDLEISEAEIVTIMGKSGAGKSTLLHILGTLDNPDSGEVIISSTNTKSLNNKQLADFRNQTIGFVFQFHHLLPEFSALENIMIPALIAKRSKSDAETKARGLLEYLGLSDRSSHKPSELSGGEQQRVAVGRALVNDPKVIFADEPTGNLDSTNGEEVMKLLAQLNESGTTIVMVTHSPYDANYAHRVINLFDGKVVTENIKEQFHI